MFKLVVSPELGAFNATVCIIFDNKVVAVDVSLDLVIGIHTNKLFPPNEGVCLIIISPAALELLNIFSVVQHKNEFNKDLIKIAFGDIFGKGYNNEPLKTEEGEITLATYLSLLESLKK
jgi:hypothetical protein